MNYDAVKAAAAAVADATRRPHHQVAVVLGSGLSSYAASLPGAVEVSYDAIPGFPVPKVEGHAGSLFSAEVGSDGHAALLFAGRVHTYEGWEMDDVVFGVRTAALAGCHTALLTNAAGGVDDSLAPGDLVTIRDHVNFTGRNPLLGANDARFGPRFPDMTNTYRPEVRALIERVSADQGLAYKEGVYAWFLGPTYETPAEVQMAKRLGADLVGMSTVPEVIVASHLGMNVVGISCISNMAAGIQKTALTHDEVTEVTTRVRATFVGLVDRIIEGLRDVLPT